MKPEAPRAVRLKDYAPSAFLIDSVNLDFVLDPTRTKVRARTKFRANPAVQGPAVKGPIGKIGPSSHQLRLDGEGLEMEAISIDGRALEASEYSVDDASLKSPQKPKVQGIGH